MGNRMTGRLRVTLNPDPWVPLDHKPKRVWYEIDAALSDGSIAGTFRGDGDYGPAEGQVSGRAAAVPTDVRIPTAPEEAKLPAEPAAACLRMAVLASRAYQQARAAALSLRAYPLSFAETLRLTTLAVPEWTASDAAPGQIRDYLSELRRLLERQVRRAVGGGEFVVETLDVGDPFFGPYFDDEPLAVNVQGAAVLPADVGAAASQRWQRIPRWRTIAAFIPDERRDVDTPHLPEIVPAAGAKYKPNAEKLGELYDMPAGGTFSWVDHEAPFRFIPPPGQPFDPVSHHRGRGAAKGGTGVHGVERARWYGFAEVESDRDVELYASAFGEAHGKLWVNDDLVWVAREIAGNGCVAPPLLKVRLRKGRNTFLFCCQGRRGASFFWVMLCTGGGPLPAEARAARRQAQRSATAALPPDPRRGRRGDWTGRFPDADPPLAWDVRNKINLVWRTPLPDYSAANPVLVGDRVFVNCEPHTLYCLDKRTGEILWKQDSHIFEFVPEDQRAAAMKSWDEGRAAEKSPERRELDRLIAAVADEVRTLEEAGQLTAAKQRSADAQTARLQARLDLLRSKGKLYSQWVNKLGVRGPGWSNNYGWTYPAPCSDGRHVWVKHNTGVLACYDLDGNRKWIKRTHMSGGVEQLPSPVLADGKVIIQGQLSGREARALLGKMGSPVYFRHRLAAYDQQTGELVWERPIWASGGYGNPGGFVPMRLSDGQTTRELLATHTGLIVDPRDGRLLNNAMGIGHQGYYADPFVVDNRVFLYRSGPVWVAQVWLEPDGRVGSKLVVQAPAGGGNAGAVYCDGYVFGNNPHPVKGGHVPWHDVHVADARTGKVVGSIAPALREAGLPYTPSASAGKYGVVTSTGSTQVAWGIGGGPAQIGFLIPGPKPYLVSTCKLDAPMVAQPVFEGRCMYARTYEAVLCIGVTGPEGEAYALREKAKTLLAELPERPPRTGLPDVAPVAGFTPPAGLPAEECHIQTAPSNWLFVGPFPRQEGKDPLDGLGGPGKALLTPGQEISFGGTARKVAPLDAKFIQAGKGWQDDAFGVRQYVASCALDVFGAIQRQQKSVAYYYAVLHNQAARIVAADVRGDQDVRAWVAGRPVREGDKFRLTQGYYPVLIGVELGAIPPFVKRVGASFRLRDTDDPNETYSAWLATVTEARPRLEEIVRDLPGSEEARRAKLILDALAPQPEAPAPPGR